MSVDLLAAYPSADALIAAVKLVRTTHVRVLETIEGQGLSSLAQEQAPGVWQSVDRMLETSRATDAGRRVASEMRFDDQSDKSVE